jgi:multicomponent Na+:H+ antiporter subunit E
MTPSVLVTATLTAIYLLVLTSIQPGDVLVGAILSALIAAAGRPARPGSGPESPRLITRLAGAPRLTASTVVDIVRGTWQVARYCLDRRRFQTPGIVAIPIGDRSPSGAAAWGFLTALSPDELAVDIDEERGVLVVHALDASDPAAVRARHHDAYERRQRRVFS